MKKTRKHLPMILGAQSSPRSMTQTLPRIVGRVRWVVVTVFVICYLLIATNVNLLQSLYLRGTTSTNLEKDETGEVYNTSTVYGWTASQATVSQDKIGLRNLWPVVYLFCFQSNAAHLLPFWLAYHSHLFGASRIHLIDHMSSKQEVRNTLLEYQEKGLILTHFNGSFDQKGRVISAAMREVAAKSVSPVFLVPLDVDEFIVNVERSRPGGFGMGKRSILRAFASLPADGFKYTFTSIDTLACSKFDFQGEPALNHVHFQFDINRLGPRCKSKVFFLSRGFISTDQGNHLSLRFLSNNKTRLLPGNSKVHADANCTRHAGAFSSHCNLCFHESNLGLVHVGSYSLPFHKYEEKMIQRAQAYNYIHYLLQNMTCAAIRESGLTQGGIQYCRFYQSVRSGEQDALRRDFEDIKSKKCTMRETFRNDQWDAMVSSIPGIPPERSRIYSHSWWKVRETQPSSFSPHAVKYVLYRILGNDIPGRHKLGQTIENLKFLLHHEPLLQDCEKRFILNRLLDKRLEAKIATLLSVYNVSYKILPFEEDEYFNLTVDTDCLDAEKYLFSSKSSSLDTQMGRSLLYAILRPKITYIMNSNGARNVALGEGRSFASWTLPWDGNSYISENSWMDINNKVLANPTWKYFVAPLVRLANHSTLHMLDRRTETDEPQIAFAQDSKLNFNEDFYYGHYSKVELLWRLGVQGRWASFQGKGDINLMCPVKPNVDEEESRKVGGAGWVGRLFSGYSWQEQGERAPHLRKIARQQGVIEFLHVADAEISYKKYKNFVSLDIAVLEEEVRLFQERHHAITPVITSLLSDANLALGRGPYSVLNKTTVAPSGDKQDYYHIPPYEWLVINPKGQASYVYKDGERNPATVLFSDESRSYDRSTLQRVFDDTYILCLAWRFSGITTYALHAHRIVKAFFLNAESRMNPHMMYAQYSHQKGCRSAGIIEMKDLYYFLDALTLLHRGNIFQEDEYRLLTTWFSQYLAWLLESDLGVKEMNAKNNHGLYYDLQVASVASFLGNYTVLIVALARAQSRFLVHFGEDGSQPLEIARRTSQHYCLFNLMGWLNVARLSQRWGINLWSYMATRSYLRHGTQWLLDHKSHWPFSNLEEVDPLRFEVIRNMAADSLPCPTVDGKFSSHLLLSPKLDPHTGVKQYWNVGLRWVNSSNCNEGSF